MTENQGFSFLVFIFLLHDEKIGKKLEMKWQKGFFYAQKISLQKKEI
jgi:hypothetical protein